MPEGHTVHRIALQFDRDFVGHRVEASSPQGRFADGAAVLDGRVMVTARAHGKQLFLAFAQDSNRADVDLRWLRVHLGLYGGWDFHGRISPLTSGGTATESLGAPRVRRAVRMGEGERALGGDADVPAEGGAFHDRAFPPAPVGQVRVRLMTSEALADLRGPTACEVITPEDVDRVLGRAGPDPWVDGPEAEDRFVRGVTSRRTPVGQLLMDQAVVSGIGNVYRAEILFRAALDPYTPGSRLPVDVARALWRDWADLLEDGIRTGVMITREDLDDAGRRQALVDPTQRHAVYKRTGEPCLRCGSTVAVAEMAARNLYWCPSCQLRPPPPPTS